MKFITKVQVGYLVVATAVLIGLALASTATDPKENLSLRVILMLAAMVWVIAAGTLYDAVPHHIQWWWMQRFPARYRVGDRVLVWMNDEELPLMGSCVDVSRLNNGRFGGPAWLVYLTFIRLENNRGIIQLVQSVGGFDCIEVPLISVTNLRTGEKITR